MRYPKEHASRTRRRIVEAAGRELRARGIDAVGVAELMGAAGLTHGGFYRHFASKADLVGEACAAGVEEMLARVRTLQIEHGADANTELARTYLSPEHRDDLAGGCAVAALAGEMGRQDEPTRARFTAGLRAVVTALSAAAPASPPAGGDEDDAVRGSPPAPAGPAAEALTLLASLVGGMILARAVNDPALSEAILSAVRTREANAR